MSNPTFNQLQQLDSLQKKLEDLQLQLELENKNLRELKQFLSQEEEAAQNKVYIELINNINLEKIKKDLGELRENENSIKQIILQKIDTALDKFFDEGGFENFVSNLTGQLSSKENISFVAGITSIKYVPSSFAVKQGNDDSLEMVLSDRDYILTPSLLKPILRKELINYKLSQ